MGVNNAVPIEVRGLLVGGIAMNLPAGFPTSLLSSNVHIGTIWGDDHQGESASVRLGMPSVVVRELLDCGVSVTECDDLSVVI